MIGCGSTQRRSGAVITGLPASLTMHAQSPAELLGGRPTGRTPRAGAIESDRDSRVPIASAWKDGW